MTVSWQLPLCWKEPTFFNSNVRLLCKNNWNRCACVLCVCGCVCGMCDAASANVFILTLPVQMGAVWSGVSSFQPGCLVLICVAFSMCCFSLNTFLIFCFYFCFFVCVFFLFYLLVVFSFLGGSLVMEAFRWSVGISLEMNIYCFLFVCLPCCCHTRPQACWWAWSCATASPPPAITTRRRRAACWRRGPSAPCCLMSAVNSLSTPSKGRSTPERSTMWSRTTCCAR